MKFKEYVLMSLRDLWRRKGRTILTSLGITIGTLLIVTMMGIIVGLKGFMTNTINDGDGARRIQVQSCKYFTQEEYEEGISKDPEKFQKENFKKLDDNLIDELKNTGKVSAIIGRIYCSPHSLIFNNKEYTGNIVAKGYSDVSNKYSDSTVEQVRYREKDDSLKPLSEGKYISSDSGEALIGEKLLEGLNVDKNDILNKEVELSVAGTVDNNGKKITKKLKIVGIIDKHFEDSDTLFLSAKDAAEIRGYTSLQKDYFENKGYDTVEVLTNEISDVESVEESIKDLDYYSVSSVDTAKEMDSELGAINKGFLILGIIVLVVASIGIVNTMGMAVIERRKSIGIMKSVGATCGAVRLMFLIQSALIGLIGGIFGIILGNGINSLIQMYATSKITKSGIDLSISIGLPWYLILLVLAFAIVLALISGIYPANRAARLDPIDALRK